jgi:pilus assembly protein CpaF
MMSPTADTNPFGPLAGLMADLQITHIMVDGPARVYVKRNGRLEDTDIQFESREQLLDTLSQIARLGEHTLDESSPLLEFHLPDGSQVNIVLPPLALQGPTMTIRKYQRSLVGVEALVRSGLASTEVTQFLRACVEAKINMVIAGEAASAKILLFNALLAFIPYEERLLVIEREARLRLRQNRVVRLVTPPPPQEDQPAATLRDLLAHGLKLIPDRVIVGELEGAETFDLLQAIQAGHGGVITSLQANSPQEAFAQLERLARLEDLSVPLLTARKLITSTVDLILQLARLQDGSQKLIGVTELQGLEGELPLLIDLFLFEPHGMEAGKITGRLKPTGNVPTFLERLKATGVRLPPHLFGAL